jgi:hypothetical protein
MTDAVLARPVPAQTGTVDALLKRYATQATTVLAVVVCVTGIMMFFNLYKGDVAAMHEWLGIGFVVAAVLHGARHRKPLASMLSQGRMQVAALVVALIAASFIAFAPSNEGSPVRTIVGATLTAPISDVAPLFGLSADQAIARLNAAGAVNAKPSQSIESIAKANQTDAFKLLSAVAKKEVANGNG